MVSIVSQSSFRLVLWPKVKASPVGSTAPSIRKPYIPCVYMTSMHSCKAMRTSAARDTEVMESPLACSSMLADGRSSYCVALLEF